MSSASTQPLSNYSANLGNGGAHVHIVRSLAASMEANLTGMELLSPLTAIFSKEPAGVGQRQIFVLTDGEVGNAPDILCYGIGRGALEAPVRRTGSFVAPRRAEGACMAQE